jgi:hypothetical protein
MTCRELTDQRLIIKHFSCLRNLTGGISSSAVRPVKLLPAAFDVGVRGSNTASPVPMILPVETLIVVSVCVSRRMTRDYTF